MEASGLFLLHILFYSAFPFFFVALKNPQRNVAFFVYMGLLVAVANFLGSAYVLQLSEDVVISAGNLAYTGFFMSAVLCVITENNLATVRSVIGLVVVVDVFVFVLLRLLGFALAGSPAMETLAQLPLEAATPGAFFVVGSSLLLAELLILLAVLEKTKQLTQRPMVFVGVCAGMFTAAVTADGALFPFFVGAFTDMNMQLRPTDLLGKLLMALSFAAVIVLYLSLFPATVKRTMQTALPLKQLINLQDAPLREEVERQRQFLELNEQQLRDLAERLSLSAAAARMGIWEYDGRTGKMVWDERTCEIYGIDPTTFDGKLETWRSLVHPDDRAEVREHERSLVSDAGPASVFFRISRADGSVRHLELHSLSQHKPDGHLHLTGVVRDVTDRRVLEEERARLELQLQQTQKMESIGLFAGGIAHDLNNLLIPILGYSELNLELVEKGSTLHKDLDEIRKAAQRAQALIEKLLAFGRQQVLQTSGVDLNAVVRNVETIISRVVDENIRLKLEYAEDLAPILADSGQIEQLLLNLVANARDAMPQGGTLTIRTERTELDAAFVAAHSGARQGRFSMLAVADDGVGIDPATIQQIFEPFFTTKTRAKGTGLGLASVYGIVQQHDGFVWVESELGKGSTCYVCLPEHDGPIREEATSAEAAPVRGGHETILVVEDDPSVRQTVCRTLGDHGYTVMEAAQPSIALDEDLTDAASADLLVTDMIMPDMDGEEMSKQLAARHPQLKTLFISGYTEGHAMNSETFLRKPFSTAELLRKVRECLD